MGASGRGRSERHNPADPMDTRGTAVAAAGNYRSEATGPASCCLTQRAIATAPRSCRSQRRRNRNRPSASPDTHGCGGLAGCAWRGARARPRARGGAAAGRRACGRLHVIPFLGHTQREVRAAPSRSLAPGEVKRSSCRHPHTAGPQPPYDPAQLTRLSAAAYRFDRVHAAPRKTRTSLAVGELERVPVPVPVCRREKGRPRHQWGASVDAAGPPGTKPGAAHGWWVPGPMNGYCSPPPPPALCTPQPQVRTSVALAETLELGVAELEGVSEAVAVGVGVEQVTCIKRACRWKDRTLGLGRVSQPQGPSVRHACDGGDAEWNAATRSRRQRGSRSPVAATGRMAAVFGRPLADGTHSHVCACRSATTGCRQTSSTHATRHDRGATA